MKDFRSLEQKIRQVWIDEAEARNTAIRKKVENVGRPNDNVKDETSKLAKQGEIQSKIIDEVKDPVAPVPPKQDVDYIAKRYGRFSHFGGSPGESHDYKRHLKRLSKETGKSEKTIHGEIKKKYAAANEEIEQIDERNIENKAKKDAAIQKIGSRNRDSHYLDRIRKSVADKIRGREITQGQDRKWHSEETEQIDELSTDTYHRAAHKAAKRAMGDAQGTTGPIYKKYATMANKFRKKGMEQEKKERSMKEEAELDEKEILVNEAGPETQPKEPKDETKDKKPTKNKDTVDAKEIKGGKTEVDLNPTTDDRTDDGKKIDDKAKKATKKANREGGIQEGSTNMFKSDETFGLPADLIATVSEALKGGQKKLDKNHNGKLDKQDFKMLRGMKEASCACENKGPCQCTTNEEIEQIDEISQNTKNSYLRKADKQVGRTMNVSPLKKDGGVGLKDTARKITNRKAGIKRAMGEEVELSAEELARIEEIAKGL